MSNHSDKPLRPPPWEVDSEVSEEEKRELMRKLLDPTSFAGATGEHPQGKIDGHDEGEFQFRIGSKDGKVILDFGSPVQWLGMPAQQASDLASKLLRQARRTARETGENVTFTFEADNG